MDSNLSPLANLLISEFEKDEPKTQDRKISVNPIVSKVATFYERLRNVMDYREEEVILRAAIERILKRRVLLGGGGKEIAEPLVRELVWARYFPDESLSESIIEKIKKSIDLHLLLREKILEKHKEAKEKWVNEWIYQLMSCDLEQILNKRRKKEFMTNFMFKVLRENITISDEVEQTRDAQVFIAVHKSFARDDLALLRYHLFRQIFGNLSSQNTDSVSSSFLNACKEIHYQLNYPGKEKIVNYVKDKTAVFFILEDLLNLAKGQVRKLYQNEEELKKIIFEICETRYDSIASKVRRAIFRSVIFILLTKAFFALVIEGTFENLIFGRVLWTSTLINIGMPPFLMATAALFIKTPDKSNSRRIYFYIQSLLANEQTKFATPLIFSKNPKKKTLQDTVFTILWLFSFVLAFGAIVFVLTKLGFNIISLSVFIFFLAIVSFLSYRISQSANLYSIESRKNIAAPIADFLILPFVRVGRHLTEGITQLNLLLFVFDFIIETPFKGLFGFFEQWFLFLQAKREELE